MPQSGPSKQAMAADQIEPAVRLAQELATLKRRREEIAGKVNEVKGRLLETQQTLSQDGSELGELTNSVAALERLVKELEASRSAIDAQQQAARTDLGLANRSIEQIEARLGEKLSQAQRQLVQQAADEADGAIKESRQTVEALQQKVAVAEGALTETRGRISSLETGSREGMRQLRELAGQIQAARGHVAKLNAAAQAAAAAGRMGEAFYLVGELKGALINLGELGESRLGIELGDHVTGQWLEARALKAEVLGKEGKAASADQLKRELATAQGELQQQMLKREGRIRNALAASESAPPAAVSETAQRLAAATRSTRPRRTRE